MISSVFSLKEANYIPDELLSVEETKLIPDYYVESSTRFLLEMHRELSDCKKGYYKSILEADNEYIIQESFSDVLSKIKAIIKKILAYIDTLIKRFVTQIAKFVNSDKYIIKMKSTIDKFSDEDKFNINGYVFTFDDNIPATDTQELNLTEIRKVLVDLNDKPFEKKAVELAELISNVASDNQLDDIRGKILGVNYPVTDLNFNNEAFAVYRDGKGEESYLEFDREKIKKAYNDFTGYKDKIKSAKRMQGRLNSEYKNIENSIDGIIKAVMKLDGDSKLRNTQSGSSTDYRAELSAIIDKLINQIVNMLTKIANLHTIAIAAKLDALNAAIVQDRQVLYKAISLTQKKITNSRFMSESITTDYTKGITYRNYVNEKYFIDLEQHRFLQECLALSESNIPELQQINEDMKMDKGNKFDKFKQFIKTIFEKFMMKLNSFIQSDKSFLTKYKDIILNKKIPEYTLNNMPPYSLGIKNITNGSIPAKPDFKKLITETEDGVKKFIMPAYNGTDDFADFCKRFYLCNNQENKDRKSTDNDPELNIKAMYEFCLSAPSAINNIKKDQTSFEQEVKKIQAEVLKVSKESVKESFVEKLYYSNVLESYINEADGKPAQGGDSGSTPPPIPTAAQNNDNNNSGEAKGDAKINFTPSKDDKNDKPTDNKDIDKKVSSDKFDDNEAKKQAAENKDAEKSKVEETGKWYLSALQTVYAAKLTAFQQIYKEYMKILRYHVRTATGSMGDSSNFSEEDKKEIIKCMKDYDAAGDDDDKKTEAANRMIAIYKQRGMVIDAHDVQNLVSSNRANLQKQ